MCYHDLPPAVVKPAVSVHDFKLCNMGLRLTRSPLYDIDPRRLHTRDDSLICGRRRDVTPLFSAFAVFPHEVCPRLAPAHYAGITMMLYIISPMISSYQYHLGYRIATEMELYGLCSVCTFPLHCIASPFVYPFCLLYSIPFVCMPQLCCFSEGGITEGGKLISPMQGLPYL